MKNAVLFICSVLSAYSGVWGVMMPTRALGYRTSKHISSFGMVTEHVFVGLAMSFLSAILFKLWL